MEVDAQAIERETLVEDAARAAVAAGDCDEVDGLVLTMLAAGARSRGAERHHAAPPAWLQRARDLLDDRFREHLGLADIAAAVGVRPARFAQSFRRHYGCSPGEYVRLRRVRWAAERLAGTETAISRIAITAGFSDQSHMTREFRRRLGVTPGVYRRGRVGSMQRASSSPA